MQETKTKSCKCNWSKIENIKNLLMQFKEKVKHQVAECDIFNSTQFTRNKTATENLDTFRTTLLSLPICAETHAHIQGVHASTLLPFPSQSAFGRIPEEDYVQNSAPRLVSGSPG